MGILDWKPVLVDLGRSEGATGAMVAPLAVLWGWLKLEAGEVVLLGAAGVAVAAKSWSA